MSLEQNNINGSGENVVQGALCIIKVIKTISGEIEELFLLVEEQKSAWWKKKGQLSIPGGRTEKGENIIDTIIRELYEEAGIIIDEPSDLTSIGTIIIHDNSEQGHNSISGHLFSYTTTQDKIALINDEEVRGRLYTKEQLYGLINQDITELRPGILEVLYLNIKNSPKNVIEINVTDGSYHNVNPKITEAVLQHYLPQQCGLQNFEGPS